MAGPRSGAAAVKGAFTAYRRIFHSVHDPYGVPLLRLSWAPSLLRGTPARRSSVLNAVRRLSPEPCGEPAEGEHDHGHRDDHEQEWDSPGLCGPRLPAQQRDPSIEAASCKCRGRPPRPAQQKQDEREGDDDAATVAIAPPASAPARSTPGPGAQTANAPGP